jgi:N-acetylglucosamine malate deacetylase 1
MFNILLSILLILFSFNQLNAQDIKQNPNQLRIMIIGAHPDDPDKAGGTAALYAMAGHKVMMVSLTNGDAGHQDMGGGPLARTRELEAKKAGEIIGIEYITLDNHDGELMPTLENRRQVIKIIRDFNPDMVFSPRPNDYHPDHRYTSILVQDAAYMVTVPNVLAKTPHLKKNPIFMYLSDDFQKPYPFQGDVVVAIDDVIDKKMEMYHQHTSQMYEWLPYNRGALSEVPKGDQERLQWLSSSRRKSNENIANKFRDKLIELYGEEKGKQVKYAEAFELSEYGTSLNESNLKTLFPFFK